MALRFRADVLAGEGEWKGVPLFDPIVRIPLSGKGLKGVWKIRPTTRKLTVSRRSKNFWLTWESKLILFCEGVEDYFTLTCNHRWESWAAPDTLGLDPAELQERDALEGRLGPVRWEAGVSGDEILLRLWGDVRVSAFRQELIPWEGQEKQQASEEDNEELLRRLLRWTEEQQRQSRTFYRRLQQRYTRLGKALHTLEGDGSGNLLGMREDLRQLEERVNTLEGNRKAAGAERNSVRLLRPPADFS